MIRCRAYNENNFRCVYRCVCERVVSSARLPIAGYVHLLLASSRCCCFGGNGAVELFKRVCLYFSGAFVCCVYCVLLFTHRKGRDIAPIIILERFPCQYITARERVCFVLDDEKSRQPALKNKAWKVLFQKQSFFLTWGIGYVGMCNSNNHNK